MVARPMPAAPARPESRHPVRTLVALVIIGVVGAFAAFRFDLIRLPAFSARDGRLAIDTRPSGAQVVIDGEFRGSTPLTATLRPGPHTMTVGSGSDARVVSLSVTAGAELSQYFELNTPEPAAVMGHISVVTDPAGARVVVDGRPVGNSPITTLDLTTGPHKVAVTGDSGSAERTVTIDAGATMAVVFSLQKVAAPLGGWLSVSAPFEVQILEDGDVIGSSGAVKIMLAGGRHDVVLANRSLDYQEARRIDVVPGKVTPLRVDPPKAMLSANARPWADVFVDGTAAGQTPIANLSVPIGTHQVLFRHPQLGERRETVVVGAKGPNRVSVDLTK